MLEISFVLLFVLAMVAFFDWRMGLSACVLMGILQDPLRKLVPNEPGYFVVFIGVVFFAVICGAILGKTRLMPNAIQGWKAYMGKSFSVYLLLVGLQAVHSFIRFGSPGITGIGLMNYLAPILAIVVAYQFAMRKGLLGIRGMMWFYTLVVIFSLSGVYLEFMDVGWDVLGEVGVGLTIYEADTILKAYSGFFRSSEMAAWHTAAVSCFLFILMIGRRFTLPRIVWVLVLIGLLLGLGVLTGRRKMLVEVAVFLTTYIFLVAWFQQKATRPAMIAALTGILTYIAIVGFVTPDSGESTTKRLYLDPEEKYLPYTIRGRTVFGDIPQRFEKLGVKPVAWAVNRYGWFGAGLGTGSQGVQHLRGVGFTDRGAAEGGLGKITMELGVPGLLLFLWLLVAFVRYIRKLLEVTTRTSPQHARTAYGLVAFLVANMAAFSVATQAFGDLFVLLLIGWTVGFLLAMPVLAHKAVATRQNKNTTQTLYSQFSLTMSG